MAEAVRIEAPVPNERISPTHWEGHAVRDLTIGYMLGRQAEQRGAHVYLHDLADDRRYTYAEVDALSDRMANSLLALGVKQYDHVCVMLDNSAACLFTHFAIGKIGAVSVPIATTQRGASLTHILNSADVIAVVTEAACADALFDVFLQTPNVRLLISRGAIDKTRLPQTVMHAEHASLERGEQKRPGVNVRFSDPAFIMFTSGTTGPAKGNVFVQAHALMWEQGAPRVWKIGKDDIYYMCTSIAHAAGLLGIAYVMTGVGGGMALAPRFSASNFLDDVRRAKATVAQLLGAMSNFVEATPELPDDKNNNLRLVLAGPMPKDPAHFKERFDVVLIQGYGLTDHSSFTKLAIDTPVEKLRSAGKVIEPYEVMIVDNDDMPVPQGEKGEILVRSKYPWRTTSGYYKRPLESMAARLNDWFHTGDLGYFDDDGYLYFVDRKKDAIRRRGENISAFEVERVVLNHPAVAEAAVYAVASDMSEDEVCVSVVVREGMPLDLPDLIRFCIKNMPGYMTPRFVHVADQLPKTQTQRVEKFKLRAWALENRAALWDRETLDEFKRVK